MIQKKVAMLGGGGGGGAPGAPAPQPAAGPHRTYAARLSDPAKDLYVGDHNVVRTHVGFGQAGHVQNMERALGWSQHVACHGWWGLALRNEW